MGTTLGTGSGSQECVGMGDALGTNEVSNICRGPHEGIWVEPPDCTPTIIIWYTWICVEHILVGLLDGSHTVCIEVDVTHNF